MMLESVLSDVTSPVALGLFGDNSVSRYFTLFDATAETHITYDTPFVSDGNLEVEFNFYVTEVGSGNGFFAMYSEDAAQYLSVKLNNAGTDYQIKVQSDGVTPGQGIANLADSKAHKANFRLTSNGTIEVFVDDVLAYESTHNDIGRVIGSEYQVAIGCLNNAKGNATFSHMNGYIWDFKMWIGGHKEDGQLWIDDPLDKPSYDVYYPPTYRQEPNLFVNLDAPYTPEKVAVFSVSGGSTELTSVDGAINVYRVNTNSSWLVRKAHTFSKGAYIVDIEFDMLETWSVQNIGGYIYSHRDSGAWVTTKSGDNGRLRFVFVNDADGHSMSVVVTSNTNASDIGKNLRIKKFNIRPLTTSPASTFNFIESDYVEMSLHDGRWETGNLSSLDNTGVLGDEADPEYGDTGVVPAPGKTYAVSAKVQSYNPANTDMGFSSQGNVPSTAGTTYRLNSSISGLIGAEVYGTFTGTLTTHSVKLFGRVSNKPTFYDVTVKEVLTPPVLPKSRRFTYFDNVAQTSMVFDSPVQLGLNWKIKARFSVEDLNSNRTIIGNDTTDSTEMFGLRIDADSAGARLRAMLPRSELALQSRAWPHDNAGATEEGVMHTAELSCTNGTEFTFTVDGVAASTTFDDIDTNLVVSRIGSMAAAAAHFVGYIADVEIEVDGAPIVSMSLDGAYQEDRANLVENKLSEFVEIDFVDDVYPINEGVTGQIISEGNNFELIRDSDDGGQFGLNYSLMDDSKEYVMECDVEVFSGKALMQFWTESWGGRGYSTFLAGDKLHYREKLHNVGKIRWKLDSVGNPGHVKFSNIRIYEITENPCARADNFLLEDSHKYTYWKKGKYLGQELITQEVWENPATVNPAWTFSGNEWTLNGNGSYQDIGFLTTDKQPNFMLLSGTLESLIGAGLQTVESNAGALYVLSQVGKYTHEISKGAVTRQVFKRQVGSVAATLTKPSLRAVLEYKQ